MLQSSTFVLLLPSLRRNVMDRSKSGHEKLFKVIMNKKTVSKFNYQELEEINFALSDRLSKVKKTAPDLKYVKFVKKLLLKIRKKIKAF